MCDKKLKLILLMKKTKEKEKNKNKNHLNFCQINTQDGKSYTFSLLCVVWNCQRLIAKLSFMVENFGGGSRKERFIGLLGIIYASLKGRVVCMYVCMGFGSNWG